MIENKQAHDIGLNARMNHGTGSLDTEAQGHPPGITVLLCDAMARTPR